MGARGPAPKPIELKVLEGNPGKRKLTGHATTATELGDPPDYLPPRAIEEWHRVAPLLKEMGIVKEADRSAFAAYCLAVARHEQAEGVLTEEGLITEGIAKNGSAYYQQHPAVAISRGYLADIKALAAQFGLTPSGRGRIEIPEGVQDEDPFARFGV